MMLSPCFLLVLLLALPPGDGVVRRRHRRDPDASPFPVADSAAAQQFGQPRTRQLKEEQKQNTHKPKFERCEEYRPEVEEESQRGTKVIQVTAEDQDGPEGPNGQVTYSIVSQNNKFTIDPQTGWLSTSAIFNRDEPDREKLVHVTVKATDNGRPQLEDVCTLAVKIKDKNDNAPVFDRASYDVKIAQDMAIGEHIMRISATDVDEGENQRITYNLSAVKHPSDIEYFKWHYQTGEVTLNAKIDKPINYVFQLKATATDGGTPPKSSTIHATLEVKESFNKSPTFESGPGSSIDISEGFSDFSNPIAKYTARSNIPNDETVFFQLVRGRTEQTNKDDTFRAVQMQDPPNTVQIFLAKSLEYEKVSEYTLTLQVRNSPDLVAEALLTIFVKDENNQAPVFTNVESGNVLEHEPAGTIVMQVSAIDNDGTYPNNKVSYKISDRNQESVRVKFSIDANTGVVTTNEEFDREEHSVYALTIDAEDGAASFLLQNGKPNVTPQKFRIAIADKNDNPPYFPQQLYRAEVPEDQDVGSKVIEVRAEDKDEEASITTYQIMSGNQGNAFTIEESTGFIRVAKPLDYETIKKYVLVVGAWDGQFGNQTTVEISILNVNDMKPRFKQDRYTVEQQEEQVPSYPIVSVSAVDPDIGDETVDQNITYYLDQSSDRAKYFSIDAKTGDVRIIKKLDRDAPNGFPTWNLYIFAKDENGGPTGIENYVELIVNLLDINDNAPYLSMGDGLVWPENKGQGIVGTLVADDYDTPEENGPPFTFALDGNANHDIKQWFEVSAISNGSYVLKALVTFDREKRKQYDIPIKVCDKQNLCAVDNLKLTIGDENDNPMENGQSEIFVYNYMGKAPDTDIGRVYVKDPDDWDLPDKTFKFKNKDKWSAAFALNSQTGMITMRQNIDLPNEYNNYLMEFTVEDPVHGQVGAAAVSATVNVTIQKIPEEAVIKSGSIRVKGTPEEFIKPDQSGISKRDKFKSLMSHYLNATYVDVFTVMSAANGHTDVRFSAHGSPYYKPEKLEGVLTKRKEDLIASLGIDITMIHIDECMYETVNCDGGSCVNHLKISDNPVTIMTNTSSFVGVRAKVVPHCGCSAPTVEARSCLPNPCLNNGTCRDVSNGYRCECPADNPEYFGPNCERLAASFNGQGWSWQPGVPACGNSHISLIFNTQADEGTLFYIGPSPYNIVPNVSDFLGLEIFKGKLRTFINFGSGTRILSLDQRVDDGKDHYLVLRWTNDTVQMELDDKTCSNEVSPSKNQCFLQITTHDMKNHLLNTNSPMHVGGVSFGNERFNELSTLIGLNRNDMPLGSGFAGCIRNLTYAAAGKNTLYDLGSPADGENYTPGCNDEFVQAVVALGINTNFLIAILVCLLVILIVVIILAVYRKRRHVFGDKDMDCDIRENIINYEDEGGGEGDQTGYDLSVLRMMSDGTPALHKGDPNKKPLHLQDPPPDIQTFLQTNKDRIDGDPDATPYDDLRHYAYEGDGNSGAGSLSSLNSGTSDADLEFDYLHNFGPRFKKLADMYGEEPDSEDEVESGSPGDMHPPSESWC